MNQSQNTDQNTECSPFYLGAMARKNGSLPTDNPYSRSEPHSEWVLGWTNDSGQAAAEDLHAARRPAAAILRLNTNRFNSPSSFRLWCWGVALRLALLAGHPVVLIGACRTGKTLLLSKITPGKVIDKREDAIRGMHPIINETEVPAGIYSVDECQLIDPHSISKLVSAMVIQKRAFCLATQHYLDVNEAIDAYHLSENAKRVVLVVVGGLSNPDTILREIPR